MRKGKSFPNRFFGGLFVCLLGAMVILLASYANGPDQDLKFTRAIPSDLSPDRLERNLSAFTRWPQWFFSMAKASIESGVLGPDQIIQKGNILRLDMDPGKGSWKRFQLKVQVEEYVPGRQLALKVLEDSSGKLTRLFDRIEWKVEIEPKDSGSVIRGTASAHTCHWKSRLFGHLVEKIVMNQVFYPNILKLADLRQPFAVDATHEVPVI